MAMAFDVAWPGDVRFGAGSVLGLPAWAARTGARHLLWITDAGLRATGLAQPAIAQLRAAGVRVSVFDGVTSNPRWAEVEQAEAGWRAAQCDALVAFGGGSVIDTAKLLVARICSGASLDDLVAQGDAAMLRPAPPFAAVPTTAGTGSESTAAALVKSEDGRKCVVRSLHCRPRWVALDPQLTLALPRSQTASTGFDAVMHALGAAANREQHPVAAPLAAQALRVALDALPRVLAHPADLPARTDMLRASWLAGVAIGLAGVDAIHGLCTPLEALADAAHGQVLAVTCEPVLRFNLQAHAARYARLARACGLDGAADTEAAERLLAAVLALRALAGLPQRLSQLGIDPCLHLPALADAALRNVSVQRNARPLARADIEALYLHMA